MPTPSPPQQTRINLADLKLQIAKKLGPDRSRQYFTCLNQLLDQKLGKAGFSNRCLLILGRENISLHNHLVRSILKNALQAKAPPPLGHVKAASFPAAIAVKKPTQGDIIPNSWETSVPMHSTWPNGDILPASPHKVRSGIRDRRIKDRLSPFGLNGRADVNSYHSLVPLDSNVVTENDILSPCDLKRSMQHHQAIHPEQSLKRSRTQSLMSHDQASFPGEGAEEALIHGGEDVDSGNLNSKRGPLQAPLGIPFCHASEGGTKKLSSIVSSSYGDSFRCYDSGELCNTEVLKRRMDKIAEAQGLEGVTMDCSDLLNNGLDTYLRRLITSCADIVRARQGHHLTKQPIYSHQYLSNHVNGISPGNNMHIQSSSGSLDQTQGKRKQCLICLQDLRVAMELNPQQLGEDWPLLLEKVCFHSYNR